MLVDNGYTCSEIDSEIKEYLDKYHKTAVPDIGTDTQTTTTQDTATDRQDTGTNENQPEQTREKTKVHKLFYRNQFSDAYTEDERVLKKMIKRNVIPKEGHEVKLQIYYKSLKSSNLIMRNKEKESKLKETNVVYKYQCKTGDCKLRNTACYIGHTRNTLSRRLTTHLHTSGIAEHSRNVHGTEITRAELVENTSIIQRERNPRRLRILEAAYIQEYSPIMCDQLEHRGVITLND